MADHTDRDDREAMAQDLDIDEKQSEEVTGGANVQLVEVQAEASPAALKRTIDKLPASVQIP
ncbi:MAG TPA: hypothetical protein VMA95_16945 [Streptosporangiaceae bacterium]|nr:hypothetical protein [Streptosporangiaceae bacterium]